MTEIYFITRHTPFWAIPIFVMSGEFGYLFWLKKKKKAAMFCMILAFLSLAATSFYYWAGGPEKSVNILKKIYRTYH
jgi:hypothetical protein